MTDFSNSFTGKFWNKNHYYISSDLGLPSAWCCATLWNICW